MARQRVAVIGAGIVGASIAYHLAERAEVCVIERAHAGAGATGRSFAWINASFDEYTPDYYRLRRQAQLAWSALERQLDGELPIQWGGSVVWSADPAFAPVLEQAVRRHQARGYATRLIDSHELRALEPHVVVAPGSVIAYSWDEASLEPAAAAALLLRAAEKRGARVLAPAEVLGFEQRGGRLVALETTQGAVPASSAVLAAGVDTPRLAGQLGLRVPLVDAPGVLAHTAPLERCVQRVLLAPEIHLKQQRDGRVVIGEHASGLHTADASRAYGERLLAEAARWLPELANASLERVTLGQRPFPVDGHPILGWAEGAPGIYLGVMHSGVTLAPLVGQFACSEILDGARIELLEAYRPSRFG